jgi:8-oxo-dGTP diphosphatase
MAIPTGKSLSLSLFRKGEAACLRRGDNMRSNKMSREIRGITSFLESDGEVLILRRSEKVSTYKGVWGGIAGQIKEKDTPEEQARFEISEETGLLEQDIELVKAGPPLVFEDTTFKVKKTVYPFLFHVKDRRKIKIDWEHTGMKWIKPAEIVNYPTMPRLKEMLDLVFDSPEK